MLFDVIMAGFTGIAVFSRVTEIGHPYWTLIAGGTMCALSYKMFNWIRTL